MNYQPLSIVILAAGQGTRMHSSLPKVLHLIGGKPMLSHVVDTAKLLNPNQIIVVYGFGGKQLKESFYDAAVTWVEQPVQKGTADAVAKALPLIPNDHRVLILYGDVPLIQTKTLSLFLESTPHDALGLLTVHLNKPEGLGRIIREKGSVTKIVEEKDASDAQRQIQEVNTGIFLVQANKLAALLAKVTPQNAQQEYYLTDIVHFAVEENTPVMTASPLTQEEVAGVNDKFQQAMVERHYQFQAAKQLLAKGVYVLDPHRFDLRGTLDAQSDVTIDVNVVLEGAVTLGKGSRVGPQCILKNCHIGDNVTIFANSYIEGATIENGAIIGPFARLRPGTVLSENAHIGNFVEIKNTTVGVGSKINHLSYIGDAKIGKNVNIGAGTITCNYDGANKHETIIEDDVHIGSDSQLIAPVRVGKGATLAAGSTLPKDAPAQQLTITHRLDIRSQDWARPTKETQQPNEQSGLNDPKDIYRE